MLQGLEPKWQWTQDLKAQPKETTKVYKSKPANYKSKPAKLEAVSISTQPTYPGAEIGEGDAEIVMATILNLFVLYVFCQC